MKSIAAIHKTYGKASEVVEPVETEVGEPQRGQALVKLEMASINPSDLGMIGGTYGRLRELPAVAGREGIGRIVALGEGVKDVQVGARVRIPEEPGVWRQYQICDAAELAELPDDLPADICAMSFVNPPTAYCILNQFADLKPGDWVIQNGAGSALGHFMIQLCRARGIKTVNMLRNADSKRAALCEMGADIVADESSFDAKEIKKLTEGRLMLGLNQIGGESVSNMIKAMGDGATVVTVGGMVGTPVRFPTRFLIFNDLRLRGFWWDKWRRTHSKEEVAKLFSEIFALMRNGVLKAPVDSTFELSRVKEALARAESGGRNGKVMLTF